MKYTFLNNTNIDVTPDLKLVTDFFDSKKWDITFDIQKTNYTLPAPVANGTDNGQTQWVIKPTLNTTGKTILLFDYVPVPNGYLTSTTINKDLISVVYNSNLWKSVAHEIEHTLFKEVSSRGFTIFDCMDYGIFMIDGKWTSKNYYKNDDPYAPDGNFAEAFKRLEPYKYLFTKMNISEQGKTLLKSFEGLRLKPYTDVRGIWTIAYGAIRDLFDRPVSKNTPQMTTQQADTLFNTQLVPYVEAVNKALKKPIKQHQFDVLVSFTFNVGITGFNKSLLLKNINNGVKVTEKNFTDWSRAGLTISKGLLNRRKAEFKLFNCNIVGSKLSSCPDCGQVNNYKVA